MTPGKGIPFVDLITPHLELEEQLVEAMRGVVRTAAFIGGPILSNFEQEFARLCNTEHCVGVSSGTDALRFALIASDVGRGDIVLTVPNTFVATIEAIIQAGATPHFIDVDPVTSNMSVDALRQYLKAAKDQDQRVKAILPVHLYGQMCDMDPIMALADEYGLMVFEDACQAHGAEYLSAKRGGWQKAGSMGQAGAFSFYPGKNLGACGEAGAVTTNDAALAQRVRMIRDHGQNKKYHHAVEGYNGRLDTLQAAVLSVKLPHLEGWNQKRREAARYYNELLAGIESVRTPREPDGSRSVYHLYVIFAAERDELQNQLTALNIGTGLHYPIPLHLQKGYASLGYRPGDFPVAEALAREILSLPMFPGVRRDEQEKVAEGTLNFHRTLVSGGKVVRG